MSTRASPLTPVKHSHLAAMQLLQHEEAKLLRKGCCGRNFAAAADMLTAALDFSSAGLPSFHFLLLRW